MDTLRLHHLLLALAVIVSLGRCDMPTESPSFAFDTNVESPLFFERSYQLMGSADSEINALIDTTAGGLDTLFNASASDNTISVSRSIDDFSIGSLDGIVPSISVDPVSFSISGESIAGKRAGKQAAVSVSFTEEGSFTLNLDNVSFPSDEDYVSLDGGELRIKDLINEFDVEFERFSILIPALRKAPYGSDDGIRITFSDSKSSDDDYHFAAIAANTTAGRTETIALDGLRLVPTNSDISYTLEGETEEISDLGVINSDDEVSGSLALEEINFDAVQATVAPTSVDLTSDANNNGSIEIENDAEAEVASIDGLGDLTDWFDSFQLSGTELTLEITTNVSANAVLYAAIQGTNSAGETVYLRGRNLFSVNSTEVEEGLFTGKTGSISASNLIKFPIESAAPGERTIAVTLNSQTSNVDEFLSNLPTEIRFIGQGEINPEGSKQITVNRPVELDASLEAYLPLQVSGEAFVMKDTVASDFSELQEVTESAETMQFREGTIEVTYNNGLPVGADLELEVIDENYEPIGVAFGGEDSPISIDPAQSEDGVAVTSAEGLVELSLTKDQLDVLDQGRHVKTNLTVHGDEGTAVSLRADDTIGFSVRGSFEMRISTD